MAQKYVGIDLGSHRVKIAVVTAGFRGAQLVDTFEAEVAAPPAGEGGKPEDVDPFLPSLQAALTVLRSRGLLGESVGIALPPSTLSYRLLSFPFHEERRIAQTIAFEADGEFPVPLEQLAYGHAVVPGTQGSARALLVATKRERVDQLATIFKRAGAELKAVTSGGTSIAQVIDADPGPAAADASSQRVSLVVDFGHHSTEMIAIGAKGPLAVRSIRRGGRHITAAIARGYGLPTTEAEAAKLRDAFVPHRGQATMNDEQLRAGALVAQAIEPIVREIEHTRLWLRSTYRCEVVRLVLSGGGAHLGGLVGYLGEQTALPCELARLKATTIKGLEGRDVLSHFAAIGAALGAARRPIVQLHDATAGQGDGGWVQERISSLAAIGIAVMAFGAIDTIVRVKALDAEREAYAADLEETSQRVLGEAVPLEEVDARLDEAEGQDVTSLIPQRGALEVLALLAQASTPSDLGRVPMPLPPGAPGAEGADDGEDGASADAGGGDTADSAALAAPAVLETIDDKAGVVVSDELVFQRVDVRERKIELKVEATRASAQARLVYKLRDIACLSNIEKGKAKGEARKVFDMVMDNNCYYASSIGTGTESPAAEGPAETDDEPVGLEGGE